MCATRFSTSGVAYLRMTVLDLSEKKQKELRPGCRDLHLSTDQMAQITSRIFLDPLKTKSPLEDV